MTEDELKRSKFPEYAVVVATGPANQMIIGVLVTDIWSYGFTLRTFDNGQLVLTLVPNTFVLREVPERAGVAGLVLHLVSAVHDTYNDDDRIVEEVSEPDDLEAIATACINSSGSGPPAVTYSRTFGAALRLLPFERLLAFAERWQMADVFIESKERVKDSHELSLLLLACAKNEWVQRHEQKVRTALSQILELDREEFLRLARNTTCSKLVSIILDVYMTNEDAASDIKTVARLLTALGEGGRHEQLYPAVREYLGAKGFPSLFRSLLEHVDHLPHLRSLITEALARRENGMV